MAQKATNRRSYRTLPPGGTVASVVNSAMSGRINVTGAMTLAAGTSTATLRHPSIGIQSIIIPQVLTIAARGFSWEVTDRADGVATVTYATLGADTDVEFAVIG
jgi:hypothetical protein